MINDHLIDFFYRLIYILLHELNQWMSGDIYCTFYKVVASHAKGTVCWVLWHPAVYLQLVNN